jgi:hypothetical protein
MRLILSFVVLLVVSLSGCGSCEHTNTPIKNPCSTGTIPTCLNKCRSEVTEGEACVVDPCSAASGAVCSFGLACVAAPSATTGVCQRTDFTCSINASAADNKCPAGTACTSRKCFAPELSSKLETDLCIAGVREGEVCEGTLAEALDKPSQTACRLCERGLACVADTNGVRACRRACQSNVDCLTPGLPFCTAGRCQGCVALGRSTTDPVMCCPGLELRNGVCAKPCNLNSICLPAKGECAAVKPTGCDVNGPICPAQYPNQPPSNSDTTCDGKDNDCDGKIDDDYVATTCQASPQSAGLAFGPGCEQLYAGTTSCVAGTTKCKPTQFCTICGPGCGGCFGETCTSSSQCSPGASCDFHKDQNRSYCEAPPGAGPGCWAKK